MERRCCYTSNMAALQGIKALNECITAFMEPHKRSRRDRMQRHRMEQQINDCNMITQIMMMTKTERLERSCGCGVEEMETWL